MKTIEQLLKPVIINDLQFLLNQERRETKYNVKLTNDINVQDKNNTSFDLQSVIQTGQGEPSQVQGKIAWKTPCSMFFQVPINYIQDFIKILHTYIISVNAQWSGITDDMDDEDTSTSINYQYRLIFKAPIVQPGSYDIDVKAPADASYKTETLEVTQIIMSGEIIHTASFAMDDEDYYLFLTEGVAVTDNNWEDSTEEYYNGLAVDSREEIEAFNAANLNANSYDLGYGLKLTYPEGLEQTDIIGYNAEPNRFTVTTTEDPTPAHVLAAIQSEIPQLYGDMQEGMHQGDTAIKADWGSSASYWLIRYDPRYKLVVLKTTMQDGYVKIQGIVNDNESLTPTVNQTNLIEEYKPVIDVVGDNQQLTLTLAVMTSDILHSRLLNLLYNSRTSYSFSFKMRQVRKSLEIDIDNIDVIVTLSKRKQNSFEYLDLTIAKV